MQEMSFLPSAQSCPTLKKLKMPHSETAVSADLRLAFLDSAATLSLPLDGYGIRYKYGLFKQSIVDGFQKEEADDWTKYGDPWSRRNESDKVIINFANQTVVAVPYDMPIVAYGKKT